MLKTILSFSAAALLLTPGVRAQGHFIGAGGRAAAAGHAGRADYRGHYGARGGRGGRYFYFGGVPYFFPFDDFAFGFGYPAYAYDYGYPGAYGDAAYGDGPYGPGPYGPGPGGPDGNGAYQGKITDESEGGRNGPSLPAIVQQQLAKRGYYKGAIDGQFGPASRSALSRFQHKNGLQETGRIDEPTLMALGFSNHQ
jgi:hypothetical protein